MPFTSPGTYASQATTGYLSQFGVDVTDASPPTWAYLEQVTSIKGSFATNPEVNVTHLQSPSSAEEIRSGLLKPGPMEIAGHYSGLPVQLQMYGLQQANAAQNPPVQPFIAVMPMQNGTKTLTVIGKGYIMKFEVGPAENNKPIEYSLGVQITGIISQTVA